MGMSNTRWRAGRSYTPPAGGREPLGKGLGCWADTALLGSGSPRRAARVELRNSWPSLAPLALTFAGLSPHAGGADSGAACSRRSAPSFSHWSDQGGRARPAGGASRLISRVPKVCRHWCGVRCAGRPCWSRRLGGRQPVPQLRNGGSREWVCGMGFHLRGGDRQRGSRRDHRRWIRCCCSAMACSSSSSMGTSASRLILPLT